MQLRALRRRLLAADRAEAGGHEISHNLLHRGEVVRMTETTRQLVDPSGAGEREHQGAGDEVIAPEDTVLRAIGQCALEQFDEAQDDRIEMLVHQVRAPFGRVRDLRAELGIVFPALPALDIGVEIGVEERVECTFDSRCVARRAFIILQRLHSAFAGYAGTSREDRVEQRLLVAEIVIQQGVVDADLLSDVLQRDAVQAVLREQFLRGVEDLFHGLGALIGLARAAGGVFGLRHVPITPA